MPLKANDVTRALCSYRVLPVLLLAVSVLLPASFAHGFTVEQLLDKSAHAAQSASYKGTFMYSRGQDTETMRVYHRISSNGFKERIQSLNGDASEIVRSEKGVWCYFPELKEGFFKFKDDSVYRIPKINTASLEKLTRYYSITIDGSERIANRMTHRLVFQPKDSFRYGLKLWIDEESGLLLRSDLLNQQMEAIDSYMFVEITINQAITDAELTPQDAGTDYVWHFSTPNSSVSASQSAPLWVKVVPDGFRKIKHVRGQFNEVEKEQMVYSDELATVSLFLQKLMQDQTDGLFVGASQLGSVNAYGRVIKGYQVTVVGEVPASTVRTIGDSIEAR